MCRNLISSYLLYTSHFSTFSSFGFFGRFIDISSSEALQTDRPLRSSRVAMIGASNGNVTLPVGVSNHGDPNLLCSPAKWTDIVIFFLGNYFAHAATIRSSPGNSIFVSINTAISALFFPASGIRRGLAGVFSLAKFGRTDLQIAARAGALCRVVRLDPEKGTPDYFQVTPSKSAELRKPS